MNKYKYPLLFLSLMGLLVSCGTNDTSNEGSDGDINDSEKVNSSADDGGADEDVSYVPEEDAEEVTEVKKAASYKDLPVWKKYDDSHWKIISPYKGDRDDFRDESIYFAMTTRFYDGDTSNNYKCWDGKRKEH